MLDEIAKLVRRDYPSKKEFFDTKIGWAKTLVANHARVVEKQAVEKIKDFKRKHIDYLDALASQINLETEWAKKQQRSTDGTLVETAENWNELIEDGKPEDFYESLRNLIMENLCNDSYFTEDKIHILRQSIEEKLKFLDYTWEDQFDSQYPQQLSEAFSSLENHLNREPSDTFKLGKKANLSQKNSAIKSILSEVQIDDDEVSSEEEKSDFTGPIPIMKKTPQGVSNKRFTSRGRGKRFLSPSNSFALSTMDSICKSEIDENDNVSSFQDNHWSDHASSALKTESNVDSFTRDSSSSNTIAKTEFDSAQNAENFRRKYSGFGSANNAAILPKSTPDYPPNGKCSSQESMCDRLNFKEIYHEQDHIGFTFLKSVGQSQYPDIKCPMGCALSSKYFFLANTKAEPSTVMAFSYSGELIKVIEGPRKFNEAAGMAVSKNDELFVNGGNTIMKFDKDLNHDQSFNSFAVEQKFNQFRSKTYGLFLISDGYEDLVCTVFGNSLLSFHMDGSFHKKTYLAGRGAEEPRAVRYGCTTATGDLLLSEMNNREGTGRDMIWKLENPTRKDQRLVKFCGDGMQNIEPNTFHQMAGIVSDGWGNCIFLSSKGQQIMVADEHGTPMCIAEVKEIMDDRFKNAIKRPADLAIANDGTTFIVSVTESKFHILKLDGAHTKTNAQING